MRFGLGVTARMATGTVAGTSNTGKAYRGRLFSLNSQWRFRWGSFLSIVALAILGVRAQTAQPQAEAPADRTLLRERTVSEDVSALYVVEQLANQKYGANVNVQLTGGSFPLSASTPNGWKPPRHLKDLGIHVWLLRSDGTALSQKDQFTGGFSAGGWVTEFMDCVFQHVPHEELVGVVVQVDGKLFVREIPPVPSQK